MKRLLFLALNADGWGETTLGLRLAHELRAGGDEAAFLALERSASAFAGSPFRVRKLSPLSERLFERHLDAMVAKLKPDGLVLADLDRCQEFLARVRLAERVLTKHSLPVLAIDTWDRAVTGGERDIFRTGRLKLDPSGLAFAKRLLPAPIVAPEPRPGVYANLPPGARGAALGANSPGAADLHPLSDGADRSDDGAGHVGTHAARADARAAVGLPERAPLVLFCTAPWQHAREFRQAGKRLLRLVPDLLAHYLEQASPDVHLVHVGPEPLQCAERLGARYHHRRALEPPAFQVLFASVDLLLSLNASATTITRAVFSGLPTLLITNRHAFEDADALDAHFPTASPELRRWLSEAAPIYPFSLWPLGWWRFLAPVLERNLYLDAMGTAELLDEEAVIDQLRRLLSPDGAEALRERQRAYVETVRDLPSGRDAIHAALE